ncbi:hypothetical protein Tco_1056457 [Tanacetum coccineum]|uniref:DUF7795 domain-containing protein n=1 Tax=Tanacetum coccineum TaxID=301880 RepID=A0ABQ5H2K4_9ASTR
METETKGKVVQIYSHFMARVAKFDELADAGNTFLVSFRQALEFIRRPSIEKTSELFEKVIKANNTHRMQSYVKAGYAHTSIRAENLNKSKDIIDELACLVEEVRLALEAASETLQDDNHDMDPVSPTSSEEETVSFVPKKPEDIDYATMVAVVYTMVKQDYVMQEKIVSALNLKTSSGELESYCLMWSLRPFLSCNLLSSSFCVCTLPGELVEITGTELTFSSSDCDDTGNGFIRFFIGLNLILLLMVLGKHWLRVEALESRWDQKKPRHRLLMSDRRCCRYAWLVYMKLRRTTD